MVQHNGSVRVPAHGRGCGDVVVTVAKEQWEAWVAERDEHVFGLGWAHPDVWPDGRVYVIADGRVQGFAPLVRLDDPAPDARSLVCAGEVECLTIDQPVNGFEGWRYRWWPRAAEQAA
jgi:hypothetical protein